VDVEVIPLEVQPELRIERGLAVACDAWGSAPLDPREAELVTTGIPVLLLSGDYDFRSPRGWASRSSNGRPTEGTGPVRESRAVRHPITRAHLQSLPGIRKRAIEAIVAIQPGTVVEALPI
jgi:hypothetical protein